MQYTLAIISIDQLPGIDGQGAPDGGDGVCLMPMNSLMNA